MSEVRKPREPRKAVFTGEICPTCGVQCIDQGVMADEETGNARDWECPKCGESVWIEE